MQYRYLGKERLKVSAIGYGCPPFQGKLSDADEKQAIAVLHRAIEIGVNFIDTAPSYGTEAVVGKAIAGIPRHQVIISTKKTLSARDNRRAGEEMRRGLEQSLKLLGTDYIDIYHLHGLEPADYEFATSQLMPAMVKLRAEGKIRFIGVTEAFVEDPSHRMLQRGIKENLWDVVMVGFNVLNPSARKAVLPLAQQKGTGVLNMFAVRRALSQPERLKGIVADLVQHRGEPGVVRVRERDEDEVDLVSVERRPDEEEHWFHGRHAGREFCRSRPRAANVRQQRAAADVN